MQNIISSRRHVIAEVAEKPVQCRLVQTDKDDLTHEQHLRWSHTHTGVQQTKELANTMLILV